MTKAVLSLCLLMNPSLLVPNMMSLENPDAPLAQMQILPLSLSLGNHLAVMEVPKLLAMMWRDVICLEVDGLEFLPNLCQALISLTQTSLLITNMNTKSGPIMLQVLAFILSLLYPILPGL